MLLDRFHYEKQVMQYPLEADRDNEPIKPIRITCKHFS